MGSHALLQGIFPTPGIKPALLMFPALAGGFFTTIATYVCVCACILHIYASINLSVLFLWGTLTKTESGVWALGENAL